MGLLDWLVKVFGEEEPQPPAPFLSEPGLDVDFRLEDDEEHVIRINQKQPDGFKKLKGWVKVAGISHPPAKQNAEAFIAGSARRVTLERDPGNEFDPNAVKVMGSWVDASDSSRNGRIGYLSAALAKKIKPDIDLAATLHTMYQPHGDYSAGVRIDTWTPRKRPQRKSKPDSAE